jgi:hypothetical protein
VGPRAGLDAVVKRKFHEIKKYITWGDVPTKFHEYLSIGWAKYLNSKKFFVYN